MYVKIISLFAILFISDSNCSCVNKNALFSVKAVVYSDRYGQGQRVSENFYFLKDYTIIDVTEANVPELCENMIVDFPKLEILSLINVNLSTIQKNSFQNVFNLQQLSLAVNNLMTIPSGSFDNLPTLETLYLSKNKISFIEDDVFVNLKKLRAVHLDRNRLAEVNGDLFRNCPRINLINVNFNVIKRLSATALKGIKTSHNDSISVLLNQNLINEVDVLEMDTINPVHLYLKGNKIRKFSSVFLNLPEGSKLYLNKNRVSCVSDDVLELMRNSTKDLYLTDNPMMCDCLSRIENILPVYGIYGQGQIYYTRGTDCVINNLY